MVTTLATTTSQTFVEIGIPTLSVNVEKSHDDSYLHITGSAIHRGSSQWRVVIADIDMINATFNIYAPYSARFVIYEDRVQIPSGNYKLAMHWRSRRGSMVSIVKFDDTLPTLHVTEVITRDAVIHLPHSRITTP